MTSLFSIWDCVLKGCFERGIWPAARLCLKGIEDFNLEHWWQRPCDEREAGSRLQSNMVTTTPSTLRHIFARPNL